MKNNDFQKGMTLIEVIISIVIAGILFGAIYQIFITGNIIFNKAQIETDLMQNARVAMDWMTKDIRDADHISISGNTLTVSASNNTTIVYSVSNTPNSSKVFFRSVSGSSNPITNEETYLETCTFTPLSPASGAVEINLGFQAFNVHTKKKQKSLSGKIPSFSIKGKVFVRKIILNIRWGGQ